MRLTPPGFFSLLATELLFGLARSARRVPSTRARGEPSPWVGDTPSVRLAQPMAMDAENSTAFVEDTWMREWTEEKTVEAVEFEGIADHGQRPPDEDDTIDRCPSHAGRTKPSSARRRAAAVLGRLRDAGLRTRSRSRSRASSGTPRTDRATAQFFELAMANLVSGDVETASLQFRSLERANPSSARLAIFARTVEELTGSRET